MNCKKYRACLAGVIALAVICGVLIFLKLSQANEIPADGTLVEHEIDSEDDIRAWV